MVGSQLGNQAWFKRLKGITVNDAVLPGGFSSEVIMISINETGTRLVNSRTDKSMRIWRCSPDKLTSPIIIEQPHEKAVEKIAWNPKTEFTFASVGRDDCVKLWKAHTGMLDREIRVVKSNNDNPVVCQFVHYSYDGELLSVVDRDSTVMFYAVNNNYSKVDEIKLTEHIYDMQWFHFSHKFFIIALHDGTAPIYEFCDSNQPERLGVEVKLRQTLTGHRSSITCLQIDPRGEYLALGSNEGVLSCYGTKDLLVTKIFADIDEAISMVAVSRDGSYLAVGYDSGSNAKIYDYNSGIEMFDVPKSMSGKSVLPVLCWFPSKTSFVYSSDDGKNMTYMVKPE